MTSAASRAAPRPAFVSTPLTAAYWEAAADGVLLLQRCRPAGHVQHYPRGLCATCWSDDLEWAPAEGTGRVWTFTVVHMPGHPAWSDQVPYVLALVELDEGPRMMTDIVGVDPADVFVGQRVRLVGASGTVVEQPLLVFAPVGLGPNSRVLHDGDGLARD